MKKVSLRWLKKAKGSDRDSEIGCSRWQIQHRSTEAGNDVFGEGSHVESHLKSVGCLLVVDGVHVIKPPRQVEAPREVCV